MLLCPQFQTFLPPSALAVQFLFAFNLLVTHSASLMFNKLIQVIITFSGLNPYIC